MLCQGSSVSSPGAIVRSLYPLRLTGSATSPLALHAAAAPSTTLWHRLGHPGDDTLCRLAHTACISSIKLSPSLCHACQLGRHVRLPFPVSSSCASQNFQLIHCDLWTSPVVSVFGCKYYLIILDDCSHYLWTFPLRLKSDTFSTLSNFISYVRTQFGATIRGV